MLALDRDCLFMARLFEHTTHDVFALAPGCERKRGPGCRFAVSLPQPLKATDCHFLRVLNGRAVESCPVLCLKFLSAEFRPDAYPWPVTTAHVPSGDAVAADFPVQVWRAWSGHG